MFNLCTTGDTTYSDTILKFLPYTHDRNCNDPCLKAQIITAVKNIDAPMLTRVWQELEHRIDVCRVTRSAHIEHVKKLFQFFCGCEH
jgi:hypothetical protein